MNIAVLCARTFYAICRSRFNRISGHQHVLETTSQSLSRFWADRFWSIREVAGTNDAHNLLGVGKLRALQTPSACHSAATRDMQPHNGMCKSSLTQICTVTSEKNWISITIAVIYFTLIHSADKLTIDADDSQKKLLLLFRRPNTWIQKNYSKVTSKKTWQRPRPLLKSPQLSK